MDEIERFQGLPDVVADGTEQGVAYHMLGNAVQRAQAHRELYTLDAIIGLATATTVVPASVRLVGALARSGVLATGRGQRFEPIVDDPVAAMTYRETPPTQRWRYTPGPRPDGTSISPTWAVGRSEGRGRSDDLPGTEFYPTQDQEQAVAIHQPMAPSRRRED